MSAIPAGLGGVLPSRSEIEDWDTSDLANAATAWRNAATASEDLFDQHRQNISSPGGTTWEGDAKDAALSRVTADIGVVGSHGAVLREAASIAENGVTDIGAAKRDVLAVIKETEDDGFRVGEDLSVTDTRKPDLSTMAARQTAATEHAEDIRWNAERLVQADAHVGERLQTKAAELEGIRFDGEGNGSGPTIMAVDFKQNPILEPGIPDDGRGPNDTFPGRDKKGRFGDGNTGWADGRAAADLRLDQYDKDNSTTVIRQEIRLTIIDPATGKPVLDPVTGKPLTRYYDALRATGTENVYVGIEVKSGDAERGRTQKLFDAAVNKGMVATGTLNGQPVEIVAAREIRAPLYIPTEHGMPREAPPLPIETPKANTGHIPVGIPPPGGMMPEDSLPRLVNPGDLPSLPGNTGSDLPVLGDSEP
ncbi:hypothetical protein [Mycolicibacterium sp.]|uniref:hypothetical protein n=1 Tax=Mycolicibacterium sp. TaxID=2320850 RepID=UPI0037CB2000